MQNESSNSPVNAGRGLAGSWDPIIRMIIIITTFYVCVCVYSRLRQTKHESSIQLRRLTEVGTCEKQARREGLQSHFGQHTLETGSLTKVQGFGQTALCP